MNKLIEAKIKELSGSCNGGVEDISFVTLKEFSRSSYIFTKHNYFTFLDNLTISDLNTMLNFLCLTKEETI